MLHSRSLSLIGRHSAQQLHRVLLWYVIHLTNQQNKPELICRAASYGVDFISERVSVLVVNAVLSNRCYFNFLLTRSGKRNGFW